MKKLLSLVFFFLCLTHTICAQNLGGGLNNPGSSSGGGGSGTVTGVSVVTANGFAGTVANPTTTPAITLSTTITGLLKGNGTAISAATPDIDYQAPISLTTTGTSGAATFIGDVLNIPVYAGGVSSVSNSDGTLTISPTTGSVVGSLSLSHANTWLSTQTFPSPAFTGTVSGAGTIPSGVLANTAVTAGSYTNTNLTVNAEGQITAASNGAIGPITLGTSTSAANPSISGDLGSGFYTAGAKLVDVTIGTSKIEEWASTGQTTTGIDTANSFIPTSSTIPTDGLYLPATNTSAIADRSLPVVQFNNPASAVNYWSVAGSATGVAPTLKVAGSDTSGAGLGMALTASNASTTGAGGSISITAGNGSGSASAGIGGNINITGGANNTSNNTSGGNVTIAGGTAALGAGGNVVIIGGSASSGLLPGNVSITGADGIGSAGATVTIKSGGSNTTQSGVATTVTGGAGGTAGNQTGGPINLAGGLGNGGASGGTANLTGGQGGATGVGGVAKLLGGAGGATSGNGGAATVQGGTPIAGAGGAVNITAAAGVGTTQNGGNVVITAGAATSGGTNGTITGLVGATTYLTIQNPSTTNSSIILNGTDALTLPIGTTAQRPSTGINGMIRYNSTATAAIEGYVNNAWTALSTAASGSGAEQTISYQPGLLSAVNATKGVFGKFVKASTVDNIEGSAITFSCVSNPTITLTNCHTDTSCATTPTSIGTVTVTAAGQAFDGTITNAAILAGEYLAWSITAGTCASVDISATAQIHAN